MKYYIDSAHNIYRDLSLGDGIVIESPNTLEDRLCPKTPDMKDISKERAMRVLNEQWRKFESRWECGGKTFEVRETVKDRDPVYHEFVELPALYNAPYHYSHVEHYFIGWKFGKVYWCRFDSNRSIMLYKFHNINVMPDTFICRTNSNCVRLIYNVTDGEYL